MHVRTLSFVITTLFSFAACGTAPAQELAPKLKLATPHFVERFTGAAPVPVSGNLIVGARWTDDGDKFGAEALGVTLPTTRAPVQICMSVASRDGRYSAENAYIAETTKSRRSVFDFSSQYWENLKRYPRQEMGVLIREVPACTAMEMGTIIPNSSIGSSNQKQIEFAINAPPERTTLALQKDGVSIAETRCKGDRSLTSISFSALCQLAIPDELPPGKFGLKITIKEKIEISVRNYEIRIDRP